MSRTSNKARARHTREFRVIAMDIVETGQYQDMYIRPYQGNVDDDAIETIADRAGATGHVGSAALAGLTRRIINPRAQVDDRDVSRIAGGWTTPRLSFVLQVESVHPFTKEIRLHYITGYTDRIEISNSKYLPDDLAFYINNVFSCERNIIRPKATQLITNSMVSSNDRRSYRPTLLRPRDVITELTNTNSLSSGIRTDHDYRSYARSVERSQAKNTIPSMYLSDIVGAVASARLEQERNFDFDANVGDSDEQRFAIASSVASELSIKADNFLYTLTTDTSLSDDGYFVWGELRKLVPEVEDEPELVQYWASEGVKSTRPVSNMDGEEWGGADSYTLVATILGSGIPMLATNHMIQALSFEAHNHTIDGSIDIQIFPDSVAFFARDLDVKMQRDIIERFMHELERNLLNDIAEDDGSGPIHDFFIRGSVMVMGDTYLEISMDGGEAEEYCLPTFASSMYSPVLALERSDLRNLASDISGLIDATSNY